MPRALRLLFGKWHDFFRAKSPPYPWADHPEAIVREQHFRDVLEMHRDTDNRMHRATRAFVLAVMGPTWGDLIATLLNMSPVRGILIGLGVSGAAGVAATYYRGS